MKTEGVEVPSNDAELDLHGLTGADALRHFLEFYSGRFRSGCTTPFKVIHGWGSSGQGGNVISGTLTALLDKHPDKASYARHLGYMIVHPTFPLPTITQCLEEQILEYCVSPRTQSELESKFHAWTSGAILNATRRLKRSGRLREVWKGRYRHFATTA